MRPAIFLVALLVLGCNAQAGGMPRQLAPELIRTEHEYCKTSTGYGVDFVREVDVDGDGRRDVVLDYAQALCGGETAPYCTDEGCLIKAWRNEKSGWRKVFEGRVKTWSVGEAGGRKGLIADGRVVAP
ncbi:MAG: hypothetical protein LWW93_04700 [Hyphomicrobiales bacterium]|nr:hypothetical protein [Hyphomicrobiales bacterium]